MNRDEYYSALKDNSAYLQHHGILGQKWGVRRYQHEDGSLTPEGKDRYGNSNKPKSLYERYMKKDKTETTETSETSETKSPKRAINLKYDLKDYRALNKEYNPYGKNSYRPGYRQYRDVPNGNTGRSSTVYGEMYEQLDVMQMTPEDYLKMLAEMRAQGASEEDIQEYEKAMLKKYPAKWKILQNTAVNVANSPDSAKSKVMGGIDKLVNKFRNKNVNELNKAPNSLTYEYDSPLGGFFTSLSNANFKDPIQMREEKKKQNSK